LPARSSALLFLLLLLLPLPSLPLLDRSSLRWLLVGCCECSSAVRCLFCAVWIGWMIVCTVLLRLLLDWCASLAVRACALFLPSFGCSLLPVLAASCAALGFA